MTHHILKCCLVNIFHKKQWEIGGVGFLADPELIPQPYHYQQFAKDCMKQTVNLTLILFTKA